jgi:hypothetical protein
MCFFLMCDYDNYNRIGNVYFKHQDDTQIQQRCKSFTGT